MAEQIAEEGADLGVLDVLGREREVEAIAAAAGTDREARDVGNALAALAVAQERSLAARRRGASHARDQEEPRLVDEDEVGAQPRGRGLFFDARPRVPLPVLDPLLVALERPTLRFLHAPAQRVQRATHVRAVVPDAELTEDHACNARRGPGVRRIALRLGTAQQQRNQALPLARTQLGRAPGEKRTRSACSPPASRASRQRITELGAQSSSRATSQRPALIQEPERQMPARLPRPLRNPSAA